MTLRKEISDFIRLTRNGAYTSDMITSDILDMIEKEIDKCLKLPTENEIGVPGEFYINGFHEGLNHVKEMLK